MCGASTILNVRRHKAALQRHVWRRTTVHPMSPLVGKPLVSAPSATHDDSSVAADLFRKSPEDLDFLDTLLERYDYLHLDTSATKWMVRTLSAHDQEKIESFFARWKHRILFGSDIVAVGEHLCRK